jgi:hypothetical protein
VRCLLISKGIGLICLLLAMPAAAGEGRALPELPGFTAEGAPREFDADSLYEYINGDSFTYLGFGCRGLSVAELAGEGGGRVTLQRFDHGGAANAFGIYSYERPPQPELLEVGGQGYLAGERLVFFKGPYYVKLDGHDLGEDADARLTGLAARLSASMPGDEGLPPLTGVFPTEGLDAESLRYVASDFMGHSFLRGAFVASYAMGEGERTAFVIDAGSAEGAEGMLGDYLAFLDKKGVAQTLADGVHAFVDPYHAAAGTIRIKQSGAYLLGTQGGDNAAAARLLGEMRRALDAADPD